MSLALNWSGNCVITSMEKRLVRAAQAGNPAVYGGFPEGATFKIKNYKLYVPVVTLSAENDNKLLEQLKTGFKRTIKWNKYRNIDQKCLIRHKNNNLNYLIDPTNHYKLIAIDLSKQIELENPDLKQQINFVGRL